MRRGPREAHGRLRLHFEKGNLAAAKAVRKGQIGAPRLLVLRFGMQVTGDNIRLDRGLGGGPTFDIGTSCINAARYTLGAEPIEVAALATPGRSRRFRDVPEAVSAVLRFPGDRLATFTCSFGAHAGDFYEVVGTDGAVRLEPAYGSRGGKGPRVSIGERRPRERTFEERDQVAPELIHFAARLAEDRNPEPSGTDGLADVRITRAIQRSIREGRAVPIEPVERRRRPSMRQEMKRRARPTPELYKAQKPRIARRLTPRPPSG